MATKYSKIPSGTIFDAKGGKYRKLDDLYYEDVQSGFQAVWNPMFDDSIDTPAASVTDTGNTKDKFLVDTQTRMIKPNPNYRESLSEAEKIFAEMWGTALFDCGPEDYDYMALQSIKSVNLVSSLSMILTAAEGSLDGRPLTVGKIEETINRWADKLFYTAQPKKKAPEKKKKKKKKPVKRAVAKKAVAKKPTAKKKGKK